jgi:hypothetical protein
MFSGVSSVQSVAQASSPQSATPGIGETEEIALPAKGFVWIRQTDKDGPKLVQVRHSTAVTNHHTGENFVKSQFTPFVFKPRYTIELKGAHSQTKVTDPKLVIYIRSSLGDAKDAEEEFGNDAVESWSLVRLQAQADRRVVSDFTFNRAGFNGKRSENIVNVKSTTEDYWTKLEPIMALSPGEYALVILPKNRSEWNYTVFDFTLDPGAQNLTTPPKPDNPAKQ